MMGAIVFILYLLLLPAVYFGIIIGSCRLYDRIRNGPTPETDDA